MCTSRQPALDAILEAMPESPLATFRIFSKTRPALFNLAIGAMDMWDLWVYGEFAGKWNSTSPKGLCGGPAPSCVSG